MSYIFPIGGGKGGIGKTFIASNIGAIFAKQGKNVVLVDLDLGGSNLHTFFGIKGVNEGLHNFLNKSQTNLSGVVESTRIPNLSIISSMNCSIEIPNLFHAQKLKIIKRIITFSDVKIKNELPRGKPARYQLQSFPRSVNRESRIHVVLYFPGYPLSRV